MRDTVVIIGESAGSDRAEAVEERVKKIHAAEFEQQYFRERKDQIEQVEIAGGIRKMRRQLVLGRTRCFRVGRDLSADTQHRQQRHHEDDDAHTAEPVREGTPKKQRFWHGLDVGQNGSACGSEAGAGLEKCIRRRWNRAGKPKGQRADDGAEQPADRHHKKAIPDFHFFPRRFAELSDDQSETEAYEQNNRECPGGTVFMVIHRLDKRYQH